MAETVDEASATAAIALVAGMPVVPGRRFELGIDLAVPAGWHTYWVNPGETGMAPSFRWTLPEGVRFLGVRFPVPQRFEDAGIVSIGYEGTARLLAEFETDAGLLGPSLELVVDADWMVCKDVCLPVASQAKVTVSVGDGNSEDAADPFVEVRRRLPSPAEGWRADVVRSAGAGLRLLLVPVEGRSVEAVDLTGAQVFAARRGALNLTASAVFERDGTGWAAELAAGPEAPRAGERFDAVAAFARAIGGWSFSATVRDPVP